MKDVDNLNHGKPPISKSDILYLIVFISLLIMIITKILDYYGQQRDTTTKDINYWQVLSLNSLDAEILWQKMIPCLSEGYTSDYNALTVSSRHVVVYQNCSSFYDGMLLAFDHLTGIVTWTASVNQNINTARNISHTEAAYFALVDDSSVVRLDYDGTIIWRSQHFDSRTVRSFELVDNLIYVPYRASYGFGFHVLSQETGQTIERLEYPNVISIYPDFIVRYTDQTLEIAEASDSPPLWTTSTFSVDREDIFTDLIGDILLVCFDLNHIKAYQIDTGEEVWSIDGDFVSYPVLTNNRLITYTDENVLEVYDVATGTLAGQMELSRNGVSDFDAQIFIAAENNIVALAYHNLDELVVFRLNDS